MRILAILFYFAVSFSASANEVAIKFERDPLAGEVVIGGKLESNENNQPVCWIQTRAMTDKELAEHHRKFPGGEKLLWVHLMDPGTDEELVHWFDATNLDQVPLPDDCVGKIAADPLGSASTTSINMLRCNIICCGILF